MFKINSNRATLNWITNSKIDLLDSHFLGGIDSVMLFHDFNNNNLSSFFNYISFFDKNFSECTVDWSDNLCWIIYLTWLFILIDIFEVSESSSDGFTIFTENCDLFSYQIKFSRENRGACWDWDIVFIWSLESDIIECLLLNLTSLQNFNIVGVSFLSSNFDFQFFTQNLFRDMSGWKLDCVVIGFLIVGSEIEEVCGKWDWVNIGGYLGNQNWKQIFRMDEILFLNQILQIFLDKSSIIVESYKLLMIRNFSQEFQISR